MADDDFGEIGLIIIVLVIVAVLLTITSVLAGAGAIFGGGTAIRNYVISFKRNVKPEIV